MSYKVTEKDLIGGLEGFPVSLVQRMLKLQVEQGNEENVEVFQLEPTMGAPAGGFTWSETKEGGDYWCRVLTPGFYTPTKREVIQPKNVQERRYLLI